MTKTWFITGATSGFGRAWTETALERGDRVAAAARTPERLDDLVAAHGARLLPIRLDVIDRDAAFAAVRTAADAFGRLDVVLNNAGIIHVGFVEELAEAEVRRQLETNFLGALWVTQAALPILRAQGAGHLVQVTSEGGVTAFPGYGAYHASKWALEGITQTLARELEGTGVHVTLVEPGPYGTNLGGAGTTSAPLPDYDALRDSAPVDFQFGDVDATRPAILQIVDADAPPLRVFLGRSLEWVRADYEERLATWEAWQPVSLAAFGADAGAADRAAW